LVELLQEGRIGVHDFCEAFGRMYQFGLDRNELTEAEEKAFSELFEIVAWFSSDRNGGRRVRDHLGDREIIEAIEKAVRGVGAR
jgi:hypothetical protein